MSNSIIIRSFLPEDQAEVEKLYQSAFSTYQDAIPEIVACTTWFIEDKLKDGGDMNDIHHHYMKDDTANKCFWVAIDETEGRVVGCVGALPSTEFDAREYIELVRMAVHDDYRGRGIAGKLLRALESFGRERGFSKVNLTTLDGMLPAMAFYPKLGFQLHRLVELDVEEFFKRKFETGNKVNVVHFTKDL